MSYISLGHAAYELRFPIRGKRGEAPEWESLPAATQAIWDCVAEGVAALVRAADAPPPMPLGIPAGYLQIYAAAVKATVRADGSKQIDGHLAGLRAVLIADRQKRGA
jgi:hypothetical protein